MIRDDELRHAAREATPLLLALGPSGALFGLLSADAGLTLAETLGFSLVIYAGASQLLALQLLALGSPLWSMLLAVTAVNIRHVLYSASIGRHLGRFRAHEKAAAFFFLVDPLFAAAETRATRRVLTKRYYFLYALILYVGWSGATAIGALFGSLVDDQRAIGLDLVFPIYFLAQTMAFRRRGGFWPVAATSAIVSVVVYLVLGAPWHVTLGGAAGIAVAALRTPVAGREPAAAEEAGR